MEKIIVADLNAVENRGLGYLARCPAILDVFRHAPEDGGDPYIAFGTKMPWDGVFKSYAELWHDYKVLKNKRIRNWCKPAVLGGGYGLGGGEEIINEYGDKTLSGLWGYARGMGIIITREFAHESVRVFRETYKEVPVFWTDMEEGFKHVLKHGGTVTIGKVSYDKWKKEWYPVESPYQNPFITFSKTSIKSHGPMVRMQLPSGRCLHYLNCNIKIEPFTYTDKRTGEKRTTDGEVIYYEGIEHSATVDESGARAKKQYKWGRVKTYGGKLCLAEDTRILTNRGIIPLTSVQIYDRLWDGQNWVSHEGVICKGKKQTITWMGLTATPDHEILGGNEWHALEKAEAPFIGRLLRLTGAVSELRLYYTQYLEKQAEAVSNAIAEQLLTYVPEHYDETKSTQQVSKQLASDMDSTQSSQTINCEVCGFIEELELFLVATIQSFLATQTMVGDVSECIPHGSIIRSNGFTSLQHYQIGIIQIWTWIESTMTEAMNPEISDWLREAKIRTIEEILNMLSITANTFLTKISEDGLPPNGVEILCGGISTEGNLPNIVCNDTAVEVFDILNAGPHHRFTVVTPYGWFVAHNCENAVQAFSRDLLVNGMLLADEMGFSIRGMFHDELMNTVEDDPFGLSLADLRWCMSEPPSWCPDIPLGAEGYESKFYFKQ